MRAVLLTILPVLVALGQGSFGEESADVTASISDTRSVLHQLGRRGLGSSRRLAQIGPQIAISASGGSPATPSDQQVKDMEGALKQDVDATEAKTRAAQAELEEAAKEQKGLKAKEESKLKAAEQKLAKKEKANEKAALGAAANKPTTSKVSSSGL